MLLYVGDSLVQGESPEEIVDIRIEPKEKFTFQYFQLEKPNRIVIDIMGKFLNQGQNFQVQESKSIRRVRVGVHPDKTRVVLDLKTTDIPDVLVLDEENTKVFRLRSGPAAGVRQVAETPVAEIQAVKPDEESVLSPELPSITTATPETAVVAIEEITPTSTPEISPSPEEETPIPEVEEETPPPAVEASPSPVEEETPTPEIEEETPTPAIEASPTPVEEETPTPEMEEETRTPAVEASPSESEELSLTPSPTPIEPALPTYSPSPVSNIPEPGESSTERKAEAAKSQEAPVPQDAFALKGIDVQGFGSTKDIKLPTEKLQELAKVNFSVDKLTLFFKEGEKPVQDLVIRNPGSKKIFINALPQRVFNPGTAEERRAETKDIIISPKRISVDADGQRTVRAVLKDLPPDLERVYEIAFSVNKESFEDEYVTVEIDGKPTKLRVVTNLAVLAFAEPPAPKILLGAERTDGGLVLSNSGSASVRLTSGKVCGPDTRQCIPISPRRLYPGNSWTLKIPPEWSVFFIKDSVLGFEQYYVQPQK